MATMDSWLNDLLFRLYISSTGQHFLVKALLPPAKEQSGRKVSCMLACGGGFFGGTPETTDKKRQIINQQKKRKKCKRKNEWKNSRKAISTSTPSSMHLFRLQAVRVQLWPMELDWKWGILLEECYSAQSNVVVAGFSFLFRFFHQIPFFSFLFSFLFFTSSSLLSRF